MKSFNLLFSIFLIGIITISRVEGRFFLTIDNFFETAGAVILSIDADAPDNAWYTPFKTDTYDPYQAGRPPMLRYHNFPGAVGGQRDLVLGYEGTTPAGSVSSLAIAKRRASIGFPENYVGGAYMQWDGDDSQGLSADTNPAPGCFLNIIPGMGAAANTTPYPERNNDFQSVDFTSGGKAFGIYIDVTTDHEGTFYFMDAFDKTGKFATFPFIVNPASNPDGSPRPVQFFNRFSAFNAGAGFDWSHVAAFQVRVWTFQLGQGGNAGNQAIDSSFAFLNTFGYVITGIVEKDCDCNNPNNALSPVNNELMDLHSGSSNGPILASVRTIADGTFEFTGAFLTDGSSYTICLNNAVQSRCFPVGTACQTVTLNGLSDPDRLQFTITTVATFTPPPPASVDCGDCTDTGCTGTATLIDCNGGTTPVATHTDTTAGSCPRIITRTFTSAGQPSVTQSITITDDQPPIITVPPSNSVHPCSATNPTISEWANSAAGAQATDCSAFTWTNNWNGQQPASCSSVTVTFTARDVCGNSGPSSVGTATYSVDDNVLPVISTPASSSSANCNQNGSDFTALNSWLASQGGAIATDNCGSVTWTNNYDSVNNPFVRSCSDTKLITFTARDGCGNIASTTASFTIADNSAPVLSSPAQNQNGECSQAAGAYTTWLNNHANAVATDVCQSAASLQWTNNGQGNVPSGCNVAATVTFTVTDGCGGNSLSTTATFTVTDTRPPVITTPATNLNVVCSDPGAATSLTNWLANNGNAVAADDCTGVTWTNNFNPSTANCASTVVTFTATDACANNGGTHSVSTTATYSIQDTVKPVFITPPSNRITECASANSNAQFTAWLSSNGGAVVTDNCATGNGIVITNDWPVGTFPPVSSCLFVATVTFTARDPCNNFETATATWTISDTTPPTILPAAGSAAVECQPLQNFQYSDWVTRHGLAEATDSCTAVIWTDNAPVQPNFDGGCTGVTIVTFTAHDQCSHSSDTTASFSILDTLPPVITKPATDRLDECTGANQATTLDSWLNSNGGAEAVDICTTVTWENNFVALSAECTSVSTVTFTASDNCGRSSSTVATYTLTDSVGPIITTPAQDRTVDCDSNTQNAAREWIENNGFAVATDVCDPDTVFWVPQVVDDVIGCNFVTVTFTVFDGCGHSSSTTATFTSEDNDAPTFNPPAQNLEVECNGAGNGAQYSNWIASHGGAVAQDDCALSFTWTHTGPATGPTTCGSQVVTFIVTDECSNSARTTATYTVVDTTDPVFVALPNNLVVPCDGDGNSVDLQAWLDDYGGAVVSDICTAPDAIEYGYTPGSPSTNTCNNERTYTFTGTDSCGNSVSADASFRTFDIVPPVFTVPVENYSVECDGQGNVDQIQNWLQSHGFGVAVDDCQASVEWTNDYPGSGPLPCSSLIVMFTVTDGCGNEVSDSAVLAVNDTAQPVFTFFPQDWELPCDADTSIEALGTPIAYDTCYGNIPVVVNESSKDEPPVGECPGDHIITREWLATDECGRSVTQEQKIVVNIVRSSGPCNPEGCVCDECCPEVVASNCISVPCDSPPCKQVECNQPICSCTSTSEITGEFLPSNSFIALTEESHFELPQCKPVYIYVNDDDDSEDLAPSVVGSAQKRMIVTNEPIEEQELNKMKSSGAVRGDNNWVSFWN